jgi:hypothetical protein
MVQELLDVLEMMNRVASMREIRNAYRILDRQLNEAWETWAQKGMPLKSILKEE